MKNKFHFGASVVAAEAVAAVVAVYRATTLTPVPVCSVLIPSTAVATVLVYLESPASDSVVLYLPVYVGSLPLTYVHPNSVR